MLAHHYEYWALSAGGGRGRSIVSDSGSLERDLAFLLMDSREIVKVHLPGSKVITRASSKVSTLAEASFPGRRLPGTPDGELAEASLVWLGAGRARPLPTALLHIVRVQSFLTPSPPDSPPFGLQEVI